MNKDNPASQISSRFLDALWKVLHFNRQETWELELEVKLFNELDRRYSRRETFRFENYFKVL